MIKTKTTFIVGAGASHAYGLPLGVDLKDQAVKTDMLPSGDLYQILHHGLGHPVAVLNAWRDDLSRHPGKSIDEFLYTRQERADFQGIGKAVIAGQMGRAINATPKTSDNWIEIVADRLAEGAASLDKFLTGNTGVQFVTFNFDSLIQDRLSARIKPRFLGTGSIGEAVSEAITVRHVHGRLPAPPIGSFGVDPIHGPKPEWIAWIKNASASVQVVHEKVADGHLEEIRQVIGSSDVVICLGWAYHDENLQKLKISEILNDGRKGVYGSAMGVSGATRAWIQRQFNGVIELGGMSDDCVSILNDFPWYRG